MLTYETENDDNVHNLKKVYTGQKLRLVLSPKDGYKLKNGGLMVQYKVLEKEKTVEKKVIINPDDKGRYYLEVPETLIVSEDIKVTAEYEKGEADKKADESQYEVTGTIAVTVTDNDNQTLIDEGAKVTAPGGVTVNADASTDVENIADGTAAGKPQAESKAKDKYRIERPGTKTYNGYDVKGYKFGLLADATRNGSIVVERVEGVNVYEFTVEANPNDGYDVGTARLIYYRAASRRPAN